MYRSSPSTSPHDKFLDQFDWDGGDWLYRHRMTGAAYRVTDAEKDAFVAAFGRRQRRLSGILFAICLLVFIAVGIVPLFDTPLRRFYPTSPPLYLGQSLMLLAFVGSWIDESIEFGAPLKKLRLRTPVAPAWSREDRQRLALDRIPAEMLFGASVICAILLAIFLIAGGLNHVTGQIFILVFIAILLWAAVTGYRKWQFARADAAITSPTA